MRLEINLDDFDDDLDEELIPLEEDWEEFEDFGDDFEEEIDDEEFDEFND